jgi:hypothetical protein
MIAARAGALDATLVDEACVLAWAKLLRRPEIDLTGHDAFGRVYTVSLHRALGNAAGAAANRRAVGSAAPTKTAPNRPGAKATSLTRSPIASNGQPYAPR